MNIIATSQQYYTKWNLQTCTLALKAQVGFKDRHTVHVALVAMLFRIQTSQTGTGKCM